MQRGFMHPAGRPLTGPQDADEMVGTLVECQVDVLICIGGDGTQKGALKVAKAIERRGLDIAVVGIPKTIDNDIAFIDRTFGFDTAVQEVCAGGNADVFSESRSGPGRARGRWAPFWVSLLSSFPAQAVKALKAGLCEAKSHLYGIGVSS